MTQVRGRTVLVTGAGSGIGYECALAFAQAGANLVVSDVNATSLEAARQSVAALGVRCDAFTCNVADVASVAEFARVVQESVGAVDVLVNNAGVAYLGNFEETPLAEWRRILDVNVMGIVHCIDAFLPAMRAAGGPRKIVNVASVAGVMPAPNMAAYAASKHAVIGLSEVLALELAATDVSVLVVCPGIINTAIVFVPNCTGPSIGPAQVDRLRHYYQTQGCHPRVVAADVLRSVRRDDLYLFTGPLARLAGMVSRLSRRLARAATLRAARESGYVP